MSRIRPCDPAHLGRIDGRFPARGRRTVRPRVPGAVGRYGLATGAPLSANAPQAVAAVGGSYPFVAGNWSDGRLARFVAAFLAVVAGATLLGLAVLSRTDATTPAPTVARAAVLAVAYPLATVATFRDRLGVVTSRPRE